MRMRSAATPKLMRLNPEGEPNIVINPFRWAKILLIMKAKIDKPNSLVCLVKIECELLMSIARMQSNTPVIRNVKSDRSEIQG